ncbi:unnamed protein product [Mycena citricolor]|uniref:Uncharacterized protein n=1 Tax=Mycena citricolor TaxID=2018698 RepID=A0AAD2I0R5_9AGAR|nr:unnamed protein product [Mycena citricolor]
MQLTSALLSLAVLLTSTAQAAPSVGVTSSLTKRWCGFDATCGCTPDPAAGCELTFDKCGHSGTGRRTARGARQIARTIASCMQFTATLVSLAVAFASMSAVTAAPAVESSLTKRCGVRFRGAVRLHAGRRDGLPADVRQVRPAVVLAAAVPGVWHVPRAVCRFFPMHRPVQEERAVIRNNGYGLYFETNELMTEMCALMLLSY